MKMCVEVWSCERLGEINAVVVIVIVGARSTEVGGGSKNGPVRRDWAGASEGLDWISRTGD